MMRERNAWLERPLSARSVIASFLLGMHPPRARAAVLVRWCALFGVADGTARVALTRMVQRGELVVVDGRYELAGRVRGRQQAQDFAVAPRLGTWDGAWRIGVVTADGRTAGERAALRDAMRALRHAEQSGGVWVRPDNLPAAAEPADARSVADAQCRWWRGQPEGDPGELVDALFGPRQWQVRAQRLLPALRAITADIVAGDHERLAEAFELGAATLAHVRADPLLPAALLPGDWAGDSLRRAYRDFQPRFSAATAQWLRAQGAALAAAP